VARRRVAIAVIAAACVLGGIAVVVVGAVGRSTPTTSAKVGTGPVPIGRLVSLRTIVGPSSRSSGSSSPAPAPADAADGPAGAKDPVAPHPSPKQPETVLVRAQNPTNPRLNEAVTTVPIDGGAPSVARIFCERLYISGPRGICLSTRDVKSDGSTVDRQLNTLHTITVPGLPSRARVFPDGRYGSVTTFVAGHAYAAPGTFSTYTALIDLVHGKVITNLEKFTMFRNGVLVHASDVNYWGVTFAGDDRHFYATLATGGHTYLVDGDMVRREMWTVHENVECPSLSPDGTRIAFKKLVGQAGAWRLAMLDLRTMRETPLAETRSIDDQVEWLGDSQVLYSDDRDVWSVKADGSGIPQRVLTHAASPTVVWGGQT
jgi:hypothetical protein